MNEKQLALKTTIDSFLAEIGEIKITSQQEYDAGTTFLKRISATIKQVDDEFEEDRVKTKAAYDAVLADKKRFKEPLERVDAVIRNVMSKYATEQENIRRAAIRKEQEEQALRQAEELTAMGKPKEAEKVLAKPETVKVMGAPAKVGKMMEVWDITPINIPEFLTHAVANGDDEVLKYVNIDTVKLARYFKDKGIKEYAGLVVGIVQRPCL